MERALIRTSLSGFGVVLIAAVCISLSNVLAPLVFREGINAYTLLVLRYLAFLMLCALWVYGSTRRRQPSGSERLHCYGAGLIYAVGSAALLISFVYLPVSLAILIFFTFPLVTLIMESTLNRAFPRPSLLACVAIAFIGLALTLRADIQQLSGIGIFLAMLAAAAVASSYIWTGRKLVTLELAHMTLHMSLAGFVLAAVFSLATGNFDVGPLNARSSIYVGGATLAFGAAFLAMFVGVRLIGATQTAMLMNLEPVLTICLAFVVLAETLSAVQLLGAALVVSAVVSAQLPNRRAGKPVDPV